MGGGGGESLRSQNYVWNLIGISEGVAGLKGKSLKVPITITLHISSQANETGGSQQTELEGAKRCFNYLKGLGLSIAIFVSDRHKGIAKWIRENCASTKHYYDIWHIARSITKKLLSASKEKGCEIIKD